MANISAQFLCCSSAVKLLHFVAINEDVLPRVSNQKRRTIKLRAGDYCASELQPQTRASVQNVQISDPTMAYDKWDRNFINFE